MRQDPDGEGRILRRNFVRMHNLKKMSVPKMAVLATGLTAAVAVALMGPSAAQATPTQGTCTGCHTAGGSVTAKPSSATPAAGAAYTVAIAVTTTNSGNTGYAIYSSDATGTVGTRVTTGGPGSATTYSAAMTAPTAAGTYYYKVWANKGTPPGAASSVLYSITVAAAPTVAPTVPPTVAPTVPPTVAPPVVPPTVAPPVVTPTVPPTTGTPKPTSHIVSISASRGKDGTRITIRGTGFGKMGIVKFGSVRARVLSWTNTTIVVTVPTSRHAQNASAPVTVTPATGKVSNAAGFRLASRDE
jgi:hypothetical protein